MARRLIRCWERSATGWSPGWAEFAAAVGSSSVVVPGVLCEDRLQVPFTEDQHPVGDLRSGGEHEPFRAGVRARAPGRYLHRLDAGAGQDRVEGRGELPGPVADQEPEARGPVTEIYQEIADLLRGPRPVRVGGHPEDVHVAGTDIHDQQAVQALQGHRAVHVTRPGARRGQAGVLQGFFTDKLIGQAATGPSALQMRPVPWRTVSRSPARGGWLKPPCWCCCFRLPRRPWRRGWWIPTRGCRRCPLREWARSSRLSRSNSR